jgi:hypothetical protein
MVVVTSELPGVSAICIGRVSDNCLGDNMNTCRSSCKVPVTDIRF